MMGLTVLAALAVYLAVSVGVVRWAARKATSLGKRGWVWGGVAAFAMYNLVFWDFLPTVAVHEYYCATEGGFQVYKTPEQWDAENPGVREKLSMHHLPEQYLTKAYIPSDSSGQAGYTLPDGTELIARYRRRNDLMWVEVKTKSDWMTHREYRLNERIHSGYLGEPVLLSIRRHTKTLTDPVTKEVLAKHTDFRRGGRNFSSGGSDLVDLKFWMRKTECGDKKSSVAYINFEKHFVGDNK